MSAQEQGPADAWGQPISAERQAELQGYLDRWAAETDHGERRGPFDRAFETAGLSLTGADVFWLAEQAKRDAETGWLLNLQLNGANLHRAQLNGADLNGAELVGAHLRRVQLEDTRLNGARLEGSNLSRAQLKGADLNKARLNDANLNFAWLERANLREAELERADLSYALLMNANFRRARLQSATLRGAQLKHATLSETRLEGADLSATQLEGADLRGASFDKASRLNDAVLTDASLDQATFDNTNLSVVDWRRVPILGDERRAMSAKYVGGSRKLRDVRIVEYQAAARAYRRLAVALQANGLSEEASGYLYRAQIMQRRLAYRERRIGAYLFSVLLAVLAGYGYRLWRIVVAYLSVVAAFALAFLAARYFAGTLIDWQQVGEAAQISLNAIHGRVFFAQLTLDSVQAWIATIESVVGIVIEGVFVAMLIQRFFGK